MTRRTTPQPAVPSTDGDLIGRSYHLIGVGGAGMSVVAQLLAERGAHVTGSDAHDSPALDRLRALGLDVRCGHDPVHVPAEATVVVSTAVKESNPELAIARERGQDVIHRSQALALTARGRDFVAVAGAHGKTTTSGMLAEALTSVGVNPSFAIGGVVSALGTGAHVGTGPVFVAEADESDRSFLNYVPRVEVVTNVEPDHLDTYGTPAAFDAAFVDFAHRLAPGGLLVACADDPGSLRLAQRAARDDLRVVTYGTLGVDGLPDGRLVGEAHLQVRVVERHGDRSEAEFLLVTEAATAPPVAVTLAVPGDHVVLDAAGAWCAGVELGTDPEVMARALGTFTGTGRRFEDRGQAAGVRVVDDYAHHPTEIEALLSTARRVAQEMGGRLLVLFQPHLFSRTRTFADRFGAALSEADAVVVTDIYPARESAADFPGVTGETVSLRVNGGRARFVPDRVQAARQIAHEARRGDLLLTVGAGDVTELADVVLAELRLGGPRAA